VVAVLAVCGVIKMLTCVSFLEGVIWLLLGTVTELTPVVSSYRFLTVSFALMTIPSYRSCSFACT
jgi:hypothetical protein